MSYKCTIVYTDFACHVAPIVIALCDRDVQAVGYYGKMKEGEKCEAYQKWRNGEVQIIVVTCAFGSRINKADVRFVIRNGLPPSVSAWAQEFGRDGNNSSAYSDNDIQHVGFWARDMANNTMIYLEKVQLHVHSFAVMCVQWKLHPCKTGKQN